MRIDSHQHFWIYDPAQYGWIDESMSAIRRNFLPEDLKPELDRNDFQGCVAVQAQHRLEETQWLLDLAGRNPFILGVVGWVDLRSAQARKQLAALAKDPKLIGIRHVAQSEPDDRFLLQPEFLRGVALLEEFDLAYDILIYAKHLPVAAEFANRFPRQRFVLDHLAKPPIREGLREPWASGMRTLAALPNVFCKLSGMVTEADHHSWKPEELAPYLDVAFELFGPERLMIGSDWPVCSLAAPYARTVNVVKDYMSGFSEAEKAAVLGGNALRFWRLTAPE
jgi:L-fucono-1,5-lactonase